MCDYYRDELVSVYEYEVTQSSVLAVHLSRFFVLCLRVKMSKIISERISKLKLEFYHVVGKLEILKNIIISDEELKKFENRVSTCESEVDVAALILGETRYYKVLLDLNDSQRDFQCHSVENNSNDVQTEDLRVRCDRNMSHTTVFSSFEAKSSYTEETFVIDEYGSLEINETEPVSVHEHESLISVQSIVDISNFQSNQIFTNSLTMRRVEDIKLTTTRENKSFFIVYSESEGNSPLGCVFTFKRHCKCFMKYECKMCRSIVDREKKAGKENYPSEQLPSAIKVVNGTFSEFIKVRHHESCFIETFATAFTRSEKNLRVQHKGQFGVTAKQAYDIFTKRIERQAENLIITPADIAKGFKTFDSAKGCLKKASKRKSAVATPNMMDSDGKVDKMSTKLLKSSPTAEPDYFLIYEAQHSGTIILGSRFLIKKIVRITESWFRWNIYDVTNRIQSSIYSMVSTRRASRRRICTTVKSITSRLHVAERQNTSPLSRSVWSTRKV